ncbi:DUF1476 domain-containing protein [Novosphingobium sp. BL-8H]|uniref:DUF1476 domain-containing protein n=1 Tax=Novosphingobium sp. BL-8H TaxID=3127640 RepID=UPI0037578D53
MIFEDRERGEEERFRLAAQTRFRVVVHRDRLMGLWAAERMGLSPAQAEDYADKVVIADLEKPGDEDLLHKVSCDLAAAGVDCADTELLRVLTAKEAEARLAFTDASPGATRSGA